MPPTLQIWTKIIGRRGLAGRAVGDPRAADGENADRESKQDSLDQTRY
jgi:hypothetical protein